MKKERQAKILELIARLPIETQEELQLQLLSAGYDVTQATVSRDIKELRIVKMLDHNGVYRYAISNSAAKSADSKHREIFAHSCISVCYAMNDVVVKCHAGMAQGACACLDMMNFPNVLGTLAGDDTIFVVTKSENDAKELAETLLSLID